MFLFVVMTLQPEEVVLTVSVMLLKRAVSGNIREHTAHSDMPIILQNALFQNMFLSDP